MKTDLNVENSKKLWEHWFTIDPFQSQKEWLDVGLQVGLDSAARDTKRLRSGIKNRLFMALFRLAATVFAKKTNRDTSRRQPANDLQYQMAWLPTWPGLDTAPFPGDMPPWVDKLESQFPDVQRELLQLLQTKEGEFPQAIYGSSGMSTWNTKYFHLFGRRMEDAHRSCPVTSKLLDQLPQNYMHTCFSCIPPGGALSPHVGPTNTSLVAHLGLLNCEETVIFSGSEVRTYREGKVLLLDDSFIHGVKNTSDKSRYTLMLSFWHPDLSPFQIKIIKRFYAGLAAVTK